MERKNAVYCAINERNTFSGCTDGMVTGYEINIGEEFSKSLDSSLYDTDRYSLETREHLLTQSAWL